MSDGGSISIQNGNIIPNMAAPIAGGQRSEDISVPDKLVGLIIGRGGESISRLQSETGCKIQMAPDSNGMGERGCTLTGTPECIQRCKDMVLSIIQAHNQNAGAQNGGGGMGGPPSFMGAGMGGGVGGGGGGGGGGQVEVMVPKDKVGLIIGKGGETIKQLMERTGAKMFILQENSSPDADKPLRIMGEPHKVEIARQMVYELMSEKDMDGSGSGFGGGRPKFGSPGGGGGGGGFGGPDAVQVPVHRSAVGVVIGKGGEMINRIQNETGARVQFQKDDENGPGDYRMCHLTGTPGQCQEARKRIEDLVESVMIRDRQSGRGRGSGGPMPPGRFGGPPGSWDGYGPPMGGGPMGPGGPRNGREPVTSTFAVPAHKCGIIIGKGGETIKWINMTAGAHCEIDKNPPPNANEKLFVIRGTLEQIDHAKRLMAEKLGIAPPPPTQFPGGPGGPGPQGPPSGQGFPPQQNWGGNYPDFRQGQQPSNPQPNDPNAAAWAAYYQQYYGPSGQQGNPAAPAAQPQPTPTAPAGGAGQPDFTQQWIEYYRSMGMHKEAEMLEQHAKSQARLTTAPQPAAPANPAPAAALSGPAQGAGQPDYSQQWIEYYKSIGKYKEAEAIEAQLKATQASAAATAGQHYPSQPTGYPAAYGGSSAPQAAGYYGGQASTYPGYGVP